MKICPEDDSLIEAVVLTWPNNNTGTIVVCDFGSRAGHCPHGRRYVCQFPFNPERMYSVNDPRNVV